MNPLFPNRGLVQSNLTTTTTKPLHKKTNAFDDDESDEEDKKIKVNKLAPPTTIPTSSQPLTLSGIFQEQAEKKLQNDLNNSNIDLGKMVQNMIDKKVSGTTSVSTASTAMTDHPTTTPQPDPQLIQLQKILPVIAPQDNTLGMGALRMEDLPPEPDFADYMNVSIQNIGWSMLFGQDYVPGEGIGVSNKSETAPIDLLAQFNSTNDNNLANNLMKGNGGNAAAGLGMEKGGKSLADLNQQGDNNNTNNNNNTKKKSNLGTFGSGTHGLGATADIIKAKQKQRQEEMAQEEEKVQKLKMEQKRALQEVQKGNQPSFTPTQSSNNQTKPPSMKPTSSINDDNDRNNNTSHSNRYNSKDDDKNYNPRENNRNHHNDKDDRHDSISTGPSRDRDRNYDKNENYPSSQSNNNSKYNNTSNNNSDRELPSPLDESYRRSFPSSRGWVRTGLNVKIIDKSSKWYGYKGIIDRISDRNGEIIVHVTDANTTSSKSSSPVEFRARDDHDIQTVLPRQLNNSSRDDGVKYQRVIMLNGKYRGFCGDLIKLYFSEDTPNGYVNGVDVDLWINKRDTYRIYNVHPDDVCLFPSSSSR